MAIAYVACGIADRRCSSEPCCSRSWPSLTIVFGIMAAVAANQGQFYRYPLSIEFIKQ